jgi:hypothetical protein
MRRLYKALFVIAILIIAFASIYLFLWQTGEEGVCKEAMMIKGSETNQTKIIEKIVEWEDKNMFNVYEKLTKGNFIDGIVYRLRCKFFSYPWWTYIFRCGACGEYSELYVKMANCLNITSRNVHNFDRDHSWAESLINGNWVHVDPSLKLYNDPTYYERNWGEHFSSLVAVYPNGTTEDVTKTYTETGRLTILVTDGFRPQSNVKITIKTGYANIINNTDSNGILQLTLGDKNYTVIAESGFLLGLKDEKKLELKENSEVLSQLQLSFPNNFSILLSDETDLLNLYVVILVVIVVVYTFIGFRIFKRWRSKKSSHLVVNQNILQVVK